MIKNFARFSYNFRCIYNYNHSLKKIKMDRHFLTEEEKIQILKLNDIYPHKWTLIGSMLHIKDTTIKMFVQIYSKTHQLFPKRGAPPTITDEQREDVLTTVSYMPEISLTTSECKIILNKNKITYHKKTPRMPLTKVHIQRRSIFSNIWGQLIYPLPVIIFTDESTAIGPHGFRTPLLRVNGSLDSRRYIHMLLTKKSLKY